MVKFESHNEMLFLKRALLSHMVTFAQKSMRTSEKKAAEVYDPEIALINEWLDKVDQELTMQKTETANAAKAGAEVQN